MPRHRTKAQRAAEALRHAAHELRAIAPGPTPLLDRVLDIPVGQPLGLACQQPHNPERPTT